MQLIDRTVTSRVRERDDTRRLVEVIAKEMWALYGVSGALRWAEVESHLKRIAKQARDDARESRGPFVPMLAGVRSSMQRADRLELYERAIRGRAGGSPPPGMGRDGARPERAHRTNRG
ncbi:MAG: hypothetical protein ACKVW3_03305 [Phycisphaerales bacterium]